MSAFRSCASVCLRVLLLICLSAVDAYGQTSAHVAAPHKPINQRISTHLFDNEPVSLRTLVGGPWFVDSDTKSTVYMRNINEFVPLVVTPVLFLSNGNELVLPQVTLAPAMVAKVALGDALKAQNIAPYATLSGYVELRYTSSYDPLCATVVSVDTVHSTIFTYGFRPSSPAPATGTLSNQTVQPEDTGGVTQVKGIWWKHHASVRVFVSLSNFTDQPVNANVVTTGSNGQQLATSSVTLPAHNTESIDVLSQSTAGDAAGGVDVTYTAGQDSLVVSGGMEDVSSGYSAEMTFHHYVTDPSTGEVSTFAELGLMTGAADPGMLFPAGSRFTPFSVVRNVSASPVVVTPELFWMQAGTMHRKLLAAMTLPTGAATQLDTGSMSTQAGLSGFNGSFNITLLTSAPASSLLLASGSTDQSGTYVFQVVPHLISESLGKTISYWSTANGANTMVDIWNPADETQDFNLTLHYEGGQYIVPIHLNARETYSLNMASLIADQVPDATGNVIPSSISEGSAKLTGVHADNEAILVDLFAGTYNARKATCSYVCVSCDGTVFVTVPNESLPEGLPYGYHMMAK